MGIQGWAAMDALGFTSHHTINHAKQQYSRSDWCLPLLGMTTSSKLSGRIPVAVGTAANRKTASVAKAATTTVWKPIPVVIRHEDGSVVYLVAKFAGHPGGDCVGLHLVQHQ